jgi:hypothetical protein
MGVSQRQPQQAKKRGLTHCVELASKQWTPSAVCVHLHQYFQGTNSLQLGIDSPTTRMFFVYAKRLQVCMQRQQVDLSSASRSVPEERNARYDGSVEFDELQHISKLWAVASSSSASSQIRSSLLSHLPTCQCLSKSAYINIIQFTTLALNLIALLSFVSVSLQ